MLSVAANDNGFPTLLTFKGVSGAKIEKKINKLQLVKDKKYLFFAKKNHCVQNYLLCG